MFQVFRSLLVVLAVCTLLPAQPAPSEGIKGNLVTVEWLQAHQKDPGVLILDASSAQAYAAGHISGAINVDLYAYGLQTVSLAEMERRIQSWGISSGTKIVIYDPGANMMATRAFFSLYYYGLPAEQLLVLDGGLYRWQQKGLPVTKESGAAPARGTFRIGKLNEDGKAELPEFLTASGDPQHNALVEALDANWHFGGIQAFHRAGHIPRGILLPSADFYNPDQTFKSLDEIRRMLKYVGIRPEQHIYTYCGGGVAASVPYFALRFILNYPNVKMYQDSELGWLADERQLPYWTYDAPFLMRDTSWLRFWGGPRIRSVGLAHVSIVDVRPSGAFGQGHVPFAVNVPAEVFQSNLKTPARLAGILGSGGVDRSHEAVIVSSGGITKEAALAFVMLESLGQERTSVLIDSLDKWSQPGSALTKDATALSPQTYAGQVAPEVVISNPKSTHGVYPKLFLASGKEIPATAQEGKVAHLPYTDLLNADGSPKPAAEIWNALTKAGVPRYAEIVCFSDDPGEAAVNYFVLKLMGFPDIKVLLI
jgi:thiosulfate/3-mercaptopyruvate sulfurtransferase